MQFLIFLAFFLLQDNPNVKTETYLDSTNFTIIVIEDLELVDVCTITAGTLEDVIKLIQEMELNANPSLPNCQQSNAQVSAISHAKLVSPALLPSIAVETSSCAYPSELFFGDTFYCQITRKNQTDKTVRVNENLPVSGLDLYSGIGFVIETEGVEEKYTFVPEIDFYSDVAMVLLYVPLQPGASLVSSYPLEMPPLEAMAHPFWEKLRAKMTPDGVKCVLSVKIPGSHFCDRFSDGYYQAKDIVVIYEYEIIIKSRPGREQELLDKWLRDTPKLFLPPLSEKTNEHWRTSPQEINAFARFGYRKSTGQFININGQFYNPWCFIRDGNRKPPVPLCPTTVDDWLELENSLVPGTMRDEIQLTRMLIDYLGTKDDAQIRKRVEIVQWLKSLPEPQSMSMASNLGDTQSMFGMYYYDNLGPGRAETLHEPYFELLNDVQPMMSHYHQQFFERVKETHKMLKEGMSFDEILQHQAKESWRQFD